MANEKIKLSIEEIALKLKNFLSEQASSAKEQIAAVEERLTPQELALAGNTSYIIPLIEEIDGFDANPAGPGSIESNTVLT